jgi:hypothetical protein
LSLGGVLAVHTLLGRIIRRNAESISPFQAIRILSSKPGRTLFDVKLMDKNNTNKNAVLVFAGFGLMLDLAVIYWLSTI